MGGAPDIAEALRKAVSVTGLSGGGQVVHIRDWRKACGYQSHGIHDKQCCMKTFWLDTSSLSMCPAVGQSGVSSSGQRCFTLFSSEALD